MIIPQWPAPARVRACSTQRQGGVSLSPWDALNLGGHVGDKPEHVAQNRQLLVEQAGLPAMPQWLEQVHATDVARLSSGGTEPLRADACITAEAGVVCAIMTADCLPVLFCSADGSEVAAAHAGWRGIVCWRAGKHAGAVPFTSASDSRLAGAGDWSGCV
ncbi:copper oxidase (laccase) domain-containing protein [Pantoea sp. AN62]